MNDEARDLDALGPAVIQFDEPVFSRYPGKVAEWGSEALCCVESGLQRYFAPIELEIQGPLDGNSIPL